MELDLSRLGVLHAYAPGHAPAESSRLRDMLSEGTLVSVEPLIWIAVALIACVIAGFAVILLDTGRGGSDLRRRPRLQHTVTRLDSRAH